MTSATGSSKPYSAPSMTRTSVIFGSASSVTELAPALVTKTSGPFTAMAAGSSKPHPRTFTFAVETAPGVAPAGTGSQTPTDVISTTAA